MVIGSLLPGMRCDVVTQVSGDFGLDFPGEESVTVRWPDADFGAELAQQPTN
jgi:hypothetical protein